MEKERVKVRTEVNVFICNAPFVSL
jgi:hypothetical protein